MALYGRLTSAIKNYMTSTQSSLAPRAEQMKKNAYRAVTPVLISLAVMIAIVLMLYYFMSVYCVNPILRMNKGWAITFRSACRSSSRPTARTKCWSSKRRSRR